MKNHNCKNISLQKKRKEMLRKTIDYELVCQSCSRSKTEITFQTENRTRLNSGRRSTTCGCWLLGQVAVVRVATGGAQRACAGDKTKGREEWPIASSCFGSGSGLPRSQLTDPLCHVGGPRPLLSFKRVCRR